MTPFYGSVPLFLLDTVRVFGANGRLVVTTMASRPGHRIFAGLSIPRNEESEDHTTTIFQQGSL